MISKLRLAFALFFAFSVSNITFSQDRSEKVIDTTALNEVVLTASLITTNLLDAPTASSFVNAKKIHETSPQLSLKEYLGQVPGLFAQNQYNYNQDLRISIRGFGARAAFGIRGVYLNIDGIPETTPDGQGQIDNIPISILSNIEVLRGPSSALYGNAAGGVILMSTQEDLGANTLKFRAMVGAFGLATSQLTFALGENKFKSLWHFNHSVSEGYRALSGFKQSQLNGTFSYQLAKNHSLKGQFNYTDSPYANDPGSLSLDQVTNGRRMPREANVVYQTTEKINHLKFGLSHQYTPNKRGFSALNNAFEMNSYAFFAQRDFQGLLPFLNGGVSAFKRNYYGFGSKAIFKGENKQQLVVGIGHALQSDLRSRFQNEKGVVGALVAQQNEVFSNSHGFVTGKIPFQKWVLSAALRTDLIHINMDKNQKRNFTALSPSAALGRKIGANQYISFSYAQSFETPTLSELSNAPDGNLGFNETLDPVKSNNIELTYRGKQFIKNSYKLNWEISGFISESNGEILPYELPEFPQRQFFKNSGATQRRGVEAMVSLIGNILEWSNSASFANFTFKENTAITELSGKRIPGIPSHHFNSQIQIKLPAQGQIRLDYQHIGALIANNNNSVKVAPYSVLNLSGAKQLPLKNGALKLFAGINNLTNSLYFDNIRINAFGGRFYEAAPTRHLYMGIELSL
jgi:iron complex outermembrane receptor protein